MPVGIYYMTLLFSFFLLHNFSFGFPIEKLKECTAAKLDFMKAFEAKQEKCLEKTSGKKLAHMAEALAKTEAKMERAKSALARISWDHVKCPEAMAALKKPADGTPSSAYAVLKAAETGARLTRNYEKDRAIQKVKVAELASCKVKQLAQYVNKYNESYPSSFKEQGRMCDKLDIIVKNSWKKFHDCRNKQARQNIDKGLCNEFRGAEAMDCSRQRFARFLNTCLSFKEESEYQEEKRKACGDSRRYPKICQSRSDELRTISHHLEYHGFQGFFINPMRREYYRKYVYTRTPYRVSRKEHLAIQAKVEAGIKKFKADYLKALENYENSLNATDRAALKTSFDGIKPCFTDKAVADNLDDLDYIISSPEQAAKAKAKAKAKDTSGPMPDPCGTRSTDSILQALDDARTNREIKRGNMERAKSAQEEYAYEQAKQEFKSAQEQASIAYNRAHASHPGVPELNWDTWKKKNHWKSSCWKKKRAHFLQRSRSRSSASE